MVRINLLNFFLDFYELLDIINQNLDFEVQKEESKNESGKLLHKEILPPSQIYRNLASRACRASIMIGTDLDMKNMKKVFNNFSTLVGIVSMGKFCYLLILLDVLQCDCLKSLIPVSDRNIIRNPPGMLSIISR